MKFFYKIEIVRMKHLFATIQYEKVESFNAKQINLKFRRNLTYHHLAIQLSLSVAYTKSSLYQNRLLKGLC